MTIEEIQTRQYDLEWYLHRIADCWDKGELGPNWCDIIATCNGWLPLENKVGSMTVHYGSKAYKIIRDDSL